MTKKIVEKRKLKVWNFLLVLLILLGLFFGVYIFIHIPVKNIVIRNTTYLNDDYILELAGIKDYPKFALTSGKSIEQKLMKSNYIEKVSFRKRLGFLFEITITENKPVFYNMDKDRYVFSNGEEVREDDISKFFRVPRLINYVPDGKYDKFVSGMSIVEDSILSKISDIEYQPNDYDKDRFLLYMDDGNMVYLTLTKFKMINHYNEVLKQLENHKGVLYLDNGNHFQIME